MILALRTVLYKWAASRAIQRNSGAYWSGGIFSAMGRPFSPLTSILKFHLSNTSNVSFDLITMTSLLIVFDFNHSVVCSLVNITCKIVSLAVYTLQLLNDFVDVGCKFRIGWNQHLHTISCGHAEIIDRVQASLIENTRRSLWWWIHCCHCQCFIHHSAHLFSPHSTNIKRILREMACARISLICTYQRTL